MLDNEISWSSHHFIIQQQGKQQNHKLIKWKWAKYITSAEHYVVYKHPNSKCLFGCLSIALLGRTVLQTVTENETQINIL